MILPKLAKEAVQTSTKQSYIIDPSLHSSLKDRPRHMVPQKQSNQKWFINILGNPKWRNQNNFESRKEGLSLIIIKLNSNQLSFKIDKLQNLLYCTKNGGNIWQNHEKEFDISQRDPKVRKLQFSALHIHGLCDWRIWYEDHEAGQENLKRHSRRWDFPAFWSWRSEPAQKCAWVRARIPISFLTPHSQ